MAFQAFDYEKGFYSVGFANFTQIFKDFQTEEVLIASVVNSLELFLWTFVFSAMLSVFFSYYIYKEHPCSGIFKVILYLPHIISGVVFVTMFKYFVNMAVPKLWQMVTNTELQGLAVSPDTQKATVMFFSIWVSFGTNVLMYTSAMSAISPSVIESAQLEGIKPMQELWYIVIPCIWPTFVTFMLVSIVGIFTNQMALHAFYEVHAPQKLSTFGYYLYAEIIKASTDRTMYPYLSAMGMMLTAVAIPITLVARYLFNKLGPKVI
jgi:ABC-type sugar transport system permease subunit